MIKRLRFGMVIVALLASGCAVNPLTPTPMATETLPPVVVRVATGTATVAPTATLTLAPATATVVEATATEVAAVAVELVVATEAGVGVEQPPPATLPPAVPATVGPPPPTAVPPVQVAPPVSADVAAAEQYCIDLVNAQRAAAGLPPYARDETVMAIARARVADMVARGYRGHNDPVTGASLGRQMLTAAGFRLAGENWYGHRAGPVAIVDAAMGWFMTDPEHAQGILSGHFTLVGVGIAYNGTQWLLIQNFAGS